MKIYKHTLTGCAPTPLAHYLKAMGVLRLLGEQKDKHARGFWKDDVFCLLSRLDRKEVIDFFLNEYQPTPFAPWPWKKPKNDAKPAFEALEKTEIGRFKPYREAIESAKNILARRYDHRAFDDTDREAIESAKNILEREKFKTSSKPTEGEKAKFFNALFRAWRGAPRQWLDAVVIMLGEDESASKDKLYDYPPLLGTGGNDGNLDFTNNIMQRLDDLFDLSEGVAKPDARLLLDRSLFGGLAQGIESAIGQFFPGASGGVNSSTGPQGDALINAWDFLLMLEGAVLFSCRASKRLETETTIKASKRLETETTPKALSPFCMDAHSAGYLSAGAEEERGEQWMPLWEAPSSLTEVDTMLGEARMQIGKRNAYRPIDAAGALSRLGVARGINSFTRFSYLNRNGKAYFAVPLGRLDVKDRPYSRLIDDLSAWVNKIDRMARAKGASHALEISARRLSDAVFAVLARDGDPAGWQAVLMAAAEAEQLLALSVGKKAHPGRIPKLSPKWLKAANDGSPEYRLSVAFGSAERFYTSKRDEDSVRAHWYPKKNQEQRVVFSGKSPLHDFAALVQRRFIEASDGEQPNRLPLQSRYGYAACLYDIAELLAGNVDLRRVSTLGRALAAIDWAKADSKGLKRSDRNEEEDTKLLPDDAWVAIRLAALPWKVTSSLDIRAEPAMLRRLTAGDAAAAADIALRRLRSSGLRVPLRGATATPRAARLWAAALAFPIGKDTARWAAKHIIDPSFRVGERA